MGDKGDNNIIIERNVFNIPALYTYNIAADNTAAIVGGVTGGILILGLLVVIVIVVVIVLGVSIECVHVHVP